MRFELSGVMVPSGLPGPGNPSNPPVIVLTYNAHDAFDALAYKDLGYTVFDVICIGGGGGGGGYIDAALGTSSVGTLPNDPNSTNASKCSGGSGGGGGIQMSSGSLLALPDSVDIEVGGAGSPGVNVATSAFATTDGGDGGPSSFNGTTCRASGGKGGKRAQAAALNLAANPNYTEADGGDGGIGGTVVAGGGGAGGKFATNTTPATDAATGNWDPETGIGSGGGGGAGGTATMGAQDDITMVLQATNGAGGAYNASDTSVYSPGSTAESDIRTTLGNPGIIIPGFAGGAIASPLNGLETPYGNSRVANGTPNNPSGDNPYASSDPADADAQWGTFGVVVIRLSVR